MSSNRYIKVLGLLAALVALSAIGAAAAQANAPVWTVKKAGVSITITASEEREGTASSTGTVTLGFSGQTLKSTTSGDCTALKTIRGSAAGSPGTITPFTLTCKNIESSVANCAVHSPGAADGTFVSKDIKGTLVWLAQAGSHETGVLFEPATVGQPFAEIEETGAKCAANTEGVPLKVTEKVICRVTKGVDVDVTEGEFNCPPTPILSYFTNQAPTRTEDKITQLKVAGAAAIVSGTVDLKPNTAGEEGGIEAG